MSTSTERRSYMPSGTQLLKGAISGGITGGIEACITFPTEYVKTIQQLDSSTGAERKYKGPIDIARKTIKSNGFRGLYRGLSVLIAGSVPKTGVRFGSFETYKNMVKDEEGNLTMGTRLLCGLGAGVNEAIIAVTPMETVKVKFIHDRVSANPKYKGLFHGVKTIIRSQGFAGTYQGLVATILRQGSNQAIRFFVVETLKDYYKQRKDTKVVPLYFSALFGGFAGACSVLGNTPIDVIKTRMQGLDAKKYSGTWDCITRLLRSEGPLAFYKGMAPRMTRVVIDVAITFFLYDAIKKGIDKFWP